MIDIVLAAGYATRLYPLTENFPKPLLEVGNKTILNWLMEDIDSIDAVSKHVIISNHKFVKYFEEWLDKQHFSKQVILLDDGSVDNDHRLGAVKDIGFAVNEAGIDEDILVIAGDNLIDFSMSEFTHFAADKGFDCVMCYEEPDIAKQKKTAIIEKASDGLILSYEEKPQEPRSSLAVPPFYYYTRESVSRIGEAIANGCNVDAPGSLAAWFSNNSKVYAFDMPGKRYDIGDLKSYEYAKKVFGEDR